MKNNLCEIILEANKILWPGASASESLERLHRHLKSVDLTELGRNTAADFTMAVDAIWRAHLGDFSGVEEQYHRLVQSSKEMPDEDRVFFTLWHRDSGDVAQPFIAVCKINRRNLDLLQVTRSLEFVEELVHRLKVSDYPQAILSSRMQGVEIIAGAGASPQVLFADFIEMGSSTTDAATAGGLLFNSFGNEFLNHDMERVRQAFPNVAEWLEKKGVLSEEKIFLLTTAHVQAHDLCGHSVPYHLQHPTRLQANWFLRAPLEEYYADAQAMWIFSSPRMRRFLSKVLSEDEIDAVPVLIAMKRLTFYASLGANDHDARCSWMFFSYWRKSGLIRNESPSCNSLYFEFDRLRLTVDHMLSDILAVEHEIGNGLEQYEDACRSFTQKFGYESPVTQEWSMPEDLRCVLGQHGDTATVPVRL